MTGGGELTPSPTSVCRAWGPAPSLRLPGRRSDLQSQRDPTVAWGQWRQSRRPLGAGSPPGEPPGRGHHAVAPPLWRLSRHRGAPWISAPSWWQHDRAATVHRRDRRGRCAAIGPLGDEVAAERVARCRPLATPASDGQGARVRFARVRFAASRFARARPPGRACGSGAQLRPQPGHRGAVAAQASPRRALPGEGSVRGPNSNVIYPGQRPGRVLSFLPPEAERAWSEARSAHSVAAYTAAKMMCLPGHKGFERPKSRLPSGCCEARPGLPMECC